jgi:hypothetical protein
MLGQIFYMFNEFRGCLIAGQHWALDYRGTRNIKGAEASVSYQNEAIQASHIIVA